MQNKATKICNFFKQKNKWEITFICSCTYIIAWQIDGEAEFSIPMSTLLKFDPDLRTHSLDIEANVTDEETREQHIVHETIQFHEKSMVMGFISGTRNSQYQYLTRDYFKPGFKYTTYVSTFFWLHFFYLTFFSFCMSKQMWFFPHKVTPGCIGWKCRSAKGKSFENAFLTTLATLRRIYYLSLSLTSSFL